MAFALTACGGGSNEGATPQPLAFTDETLTQFRPYAQGEYVIRSRDELKAAWVEAPFAVFPVGIVLTEPSFPEYNFQSSTLVGISLGIGKWCFAPQITRVSRLGSNLEIDYRVPTTSTSACLRDAPLVSFVLVPRSDGLVTFRKLGA